MYMWTIPKLNNNHPQGKTLPIQVCFSILTIFIGSASLAPVGGLVSAYEASW